MARWVRSKWSVVGVWVAWWLGGQIGRPGIATVRLSSGEAVILCYTSKPPNSLGPRPLVSSPRGNGFEPQHRGPWFGLSGCHPIGDKARSIVNSRFWCPALVATVSRLSIEIRGFVFQTINLVTIQN